MTLTPVEIRHIKPERAFIGGYDKGAIDELLLDIATSFEDVWRERADLADKVEQLEADIGRFKSSRACSAQLSSPPSGRRSGSRSRRARRPT